VSKKDLTGQNLGRYHIVEPLGQGGMASVYKAYDTSLERNVAIKIIRADIEEGNEGDFLKRFQREARALAQLDHPFILKVLDYGEQDGIPYLVMPFVPGGTLKEKMGVAMPFQQAAALLAPIARALEFAHAQKIIHRDVKPANILMSQSGAPLLSDFGIAKIIAGSGSTQLTAAGVGIGTPDYMAPEQWLGVADPGTDIYSLGVVFYEMVTGHRPYTADTPAAVMLKHMRDPLPRPTTFVHNLPTTVEQVLFKALAKEPENRYQSMSAFAAALERLMQSESTILSPIPQDIETLIGTEKTVLTAAAIPATYTGQIAAAPKKMEPWMIALAAVAGLAVLVLLCVLAGGTLFASRSLLNPKQNTAVAGENTNSTNAPDNNPTAAPGATPAGKATAIRTATAEPTPTALQSIEGFPEDVPFLKENNGDLMTQAAQGMQSFMFSSNLPIADLSDFYLNGMKDNGWEMVNEMTQDKIKIWYFTKDPKRMIMISLSPDKNSTRISVMIPPVE
jgi:hypothetical protein